MLNRALPATVLTILLVLPAAGAAQVHPPTAVASESGTALQQQMRQLWTDHVVWMRSYIVAALGEQPEATAAAGRMMRTQEEIGGALAVFYGEEAGGQLTTLLKDHVAIAMDLVQASQAKDAAAQDAADTRWQMNALSIADALAKANPLWTRAALANMMDMHLTTISAMITARLNRDWDGDVRAFDAVNAHVVRMADALTAGIVQQFPDRFAAR